MTIQFDDKGKFFTDYVTKKVLAARIQTQTHFIEGEIYVRVNERVSDELNQLDQFLAVTNATVFAPGGEVLYHCGFMTVNRDHIVWLIPEDKDQDQPAEVGGIP